VIDILVGGLCPPNIIAVENRSHKETYQLPPPCINPMWLGNHIYLGGVH